MAITRIQAINFLLERPVDYAHMLGFTKLGEMHNKWIVDMVTGKEDKTLQGHRESFKTTCLSVSLALIIILLPSYKTLFMRKTDNDVKEIIRQVEKILQAPHTLHFIDAIYGVNLKFAIANSTEITTNLSRDARGTSQLVGMGSGASITGKHFERIFTDDIVNLNDRISQAERDRTKLVYQELQNVKNKGVGRIFNSGTPWHKEDCFSIMPNPDKYDCYTTGIMDEATIEDLKDKMLPSLFACNYELKIIAAEDLIFPEREIGADIGFVRNAICHVDSAFYGTDYTAFTVMAYINDRFYTYGKCWRKNVQDCYQDIYNDYERLQLGKCFMETNADKGMVARDMKKLGFRMATYNEHVNKHIKIVTYLKAIWSRVIFVEGTDAEYINMIYDYTEDAEHDDCPDSAACLARRLYKKAGIRLITNLTDVREEDV